MKAKVLYLALIVLTVCSCSKSEPKLLDEENKTFFVNGISAMDGKDAIIKSLEDMGFKLDGKIEELDLSIIGKSFTYYGQWKIKTLDEKQISTLTGGIFNNLPSNPDLKKIGDSGISNKYRVFLEWYKSGQIKKVTIEIGEFYELSPEDYTEVNKRLSQIFPHSKIGNSTWGYMTYYNDNGVELYYTNKLCLQLEKK